MSSNGMIDESFAAPHFNNMGYSAESQALFLVMEAEYSETDD